ncbi:hypothetical protein CCHL11_00691 [Colletotrichum chlorophyti]|uniref:Uncharacterized protein n=1 Tax=Colletotrichum chlorophyti TaxID=708187 RepID=A0A1Q8S5E7_9PEZI|nr:hypothetical protein CCHL11_00691 [Colletotrichum chlorophyti]
MSFYQGDSRKGESPAPPPRALTSVEIGVIVGTVTVFVGVVGLLFCYRSRKAKRRRDDGEAVMLDDDDGGHMRPDTSHHKNDYASSREVEPLERPPPTRKKRIWDSYGGAKAYEASS